MKHTIIKGIFIFIIGYVMFVGIGYYSVEDESITYIQTSKSFVN